MKKKILIIGGIILALGVGLWAGLKVFKGSPVFGLADAYFLDNATDVFGTKTATTTAGQAFRVTATGGQSATSSVVKKIAPEVNEAIFTVMATNASSTANLMWDFQGSNDYGCETTSSTAGATNNFPLTTEINWFSLGDHTPYKTQTSSFANASSTQTYVWTNPIANKTNGQVVILKDLNYKCIKMNMSGSSTEAWVQISTK